MSPNPLRFCFSGIHTNNYSNFPTLQRSILTNICINRFRADLLNLFSPEIICSSYLLQSFTTFCPLMNFLFFSLFLHHWQKCTKYIPIIYKPHWCFMINNPSNIFHLVLLNYNYNKNVLFSSCLNNFNVPVGTCRSNHQQFSSYHFCQFSPRFLLTKKYECGSA